MLSSPRSALWAGSSCPSGKEEQLCQNQLLMQSMVLLPLMMLPDVPDRPATNRDAPGQQPRLRPASAQRRKSWDAATCKSAQTLSLRRQPLSNRILHAFFTSFSALGWFVLSLWKRKEFMSKQAGDAGDGPAPDDDALRRARSVSNKSRCSLSAASSSTCICTSQEVMSKFLHALLEGQLRRGHADNAGSARMPSSSLKLHGALPLARFATKSHTSLSLSSGLSSEGNPRSIRPSPGFLTLPQH